MFLNYDNSAAVHVLFIMIEMYLPEFLLVFLWHVSIANTIQPILTTTVPFLKCSLSKKQTKTPQTKERTNKQK